MPVTRETPCTSTMKGSAPISSATNSWEPHSVTSTPISSMNRRCGQNFSLDMFDYTPSVRIPLSTV